MSLPASVLTRAARIRLLTLDVDGVLTDGTLYYGADGETLKAFHVRDGLGVKLLRAEGIEVAVISGKTGAPLSRRLADLGIVHAHLACEGKLAALEALCAELAVSPTEVAHVGDDLLDVPVMQRVGLGVAVADAHESARGAADFVTQTAGGRGAVREIADALLDARGRREAAYAAYLLTCGTTNEKNKFSRKDAKTQR